jgi:hypothetical protein
VVFAALGIVWFVYFLDHLIASASTERWLITMVAFVNAKLESQSAPTWITAAATIALVSATVYLWRATVALSRAANVQFNSDGPFLVFSLHSAGVTLNAAAQAVLTNTAFPPYAWEQEDQSNAHLRASISGDPNFVSLFVSNRSLKAHGVATAVRVTARLDFGAPAATVRRTARFATIGANTYEALHLFNVGNLPAYVATVEEVCYKDINERDRRASTGIGGLECGPNGTKVTTTAFKPRRGELTDAIDR